MKKLFVLLGLSVAISACAHEPIGSTAILGKVTVVNEYGNDITRYCTKTLRRGGAFAQNASKGKNHFEQITCVNGYDLYRIKGDRFTVNVPKENTLVNFGDVTIALNGDGSFDVTGGNGKLKVADATNGWSKHVIGNIGGR